MKRTPIKVTAPTRDTDRLSQLEGEDSPRKSLAKSVQAFYEIFPCGGDDASDDNRWERLPWMKTEFGPDRHKGDRTLDLGCGTGIDALRFVRGDAALVGVDFACRPLALARQRLGRRTPGGTFWLVRADARRLPFKDNVFDYAYSDGVLHHIDGYDKALRELQRCLKPAGSATILMYHRWSLMTMLTLITRACLRRERMRDWLLRRSASKSTTAGLAEVLEHPLSRFLSKAELETVLVGSGFSVTAIRSYDWAFPLVRRSNRTEPSRLDGVGGRFLVARVEKVRPRE